MSKGKKIALSLFAIFAVVIAGFAVIIPLAVDIDRYRPQVIAQIQRETGKPVAIRRMTLTVFPRVGIRLDDFSLGNGAGFPAGNFVKVKKILAVVDADALLHHKVEITALKLQDLTLEMLEDAYGKWNFETSPGSRGTAPSSTAARGRSFTLGVISRLSVARGQISAANLPASGVRGPSLFELHGATIDLYHVDLNAMTTSSARLAAAPPGELALQLSSLHGPVYASDAPGPELADGTIKADTLLMGPISVAKMKSELRLFPKRVFFDGLDLHCYNGSAQGNLSLDLEGANLAYAVDATVKDVEVAEFLDAFPQTRGLMTGTLAGAVKMQGLVFKSADPLSEVSGTGHATIRDGKMPSLQITGNLRSLARMAGVGSADGDPSSFSSLSSDFRIADGRLSSEKIDLAGNGVDVDGSGWLTLESEGSLDYRGEASLAANGNNPLASILGGLAGAKFAGGKMIFPFTVGGTMARPKFSLKGSAGREAGADQETAPEPGNLMRGLSGFLKKKKQR